MKQNSSIYLICYASVVPCRPQTWAFSLIIHHRLEMRLGYLGHERKLDSSMTQSIAVSTQDHTPFQHLITLDGIQNIARVL
ncbi:hypothetical protein CC78DRAFT_232636 [Lojkania enalia]|uniref:Uncharacterized protein n=1 Tax=Lojkania enalia TaxID=147567 RepID=A0A9P4N3D0_9PLEO|nr:hypothetical protein CC78DRAFT_232636 [Didymosphaeria enalia]